MASRNGTELEGRILHYDGDSSFKLTALYDYILAGNALDSTIFVTEYSKEVRQFNDMNPKTQLLKKEIIKDFDLSWNIPDKYLNLNISAYILKRLLFELESNPDFSESDIDVRMKRVNQELKLYQEYKLENILKAVIYIVEEFEKNGVVWGTGRGSSCCSYCLYLIKLHDVDSIRYGLELNEFFR